VKFALTFRVYVTDDAVPNPASFIVTEYSAVFGLKLAVALR